MTKVKGFEGFDDFDDVDTNADYAKPVAQGLDNVDAAVVVKRLYRLTQSTVNCIEHYANEDEVVYADVVRAAVYLLKNTTKSERAIAYSNTRIIKKRPGPKVK